MSIYIHVYIYIYVVVCYNCFMSAASRFFSPSGPTRACAVDSSKRHRRAASQLEGLAASSKCQPKPHLQQCHQRSVGSLGRWAWPDAAAQSASEDIREHVVVCYNCFMSAASRFFSPSGPTRACAVDSSKRHRRAASQLEGLAASSKCQPKPHLQQCHHSSKGQPGKGWRASARKFAELHDFISPG